MSKQSSNLVISISPKKIAKFLTLIVVGFTLVNLAGFFIQYVLGFRRLDRFIGLLNVGDDSSIPTWYSSFALLICATLLMVIAIVKGRRKEPYFCHWAMLSIIFMVMSIDEVVMIHENMGDILGESFKNGFFYYSWVILAIPAIIIFALAYLKFIIHLPTKIRHLFLIAGAIFVMGGLGLEMLSAFYDSLYRTSNLTYNLIMIAEEFLEMLGIIIFIYALLSYLKLHLTAIQVFIKQ
ncbi:MAG TPA: hypothetical protein V6C71_24025 [Coleofasciculaceae cyanobacterium]|jgi:hypothetical protein